MTLVQWGMRFERRWHEEPDLWDVVPGVGLSDHGAHIYGIPFFDSHPSFVGKINWKVVEGGYVRGI